MKLKILFSIAMFIMSVNSSARDGFDRTLIIENNTRYELEYLYAQNVGQTRPVRDLLGRYVIDSFSEKMVDAEDNSGYCLYHIMAVFEDGDEVYDTVNACEDVYWEVYE